MTILPETAIHRSSDYKGHEDGDDDGADGYKIDDNEFLQWEITEEAITAHDLEVWMIMQHNENIVDFETAQQVHFEQNQDEASDRDALCTAGGKECFWCVREEREVSGGKTLRPV